MELKKENRRSNNERNFEGISGVRSIAHLDPDTSVTSGGSQNWDRWEADYDTSAASRWAAEYNAPLVTLHSVQDSLNLSMQRNGRFCCHTVIKTLVY